MAISADHPAIAERARRAFIEGLRAGVPSVTGVVEAGARALVGEVAEPRVVMRRRQVVEDLQRMLQPWRSHIDTMLRAALDGVEFSPSHFCELAAGSVSGGGPSRLALVENAAIEGEILSSRLALAMMDRVSWEFTDLRSRITQLEGRSELDNTDVLRPHVFARIVTTAWQMAGLGQDDWRVLQTLLHAEFSRFLEEAYHEGNRTLIALGVMPEIDLRPLIRRAADTGVPPARSGFGPTTGAAPGLRGPGDSRGSGAQGVGGAGGYGNDGDGGYGGGAGGRLSGGRWDETRAPRSHVGEETRLMTRPSTLSRAGDQAEAVLGRLNRLIGRQLPQFAQTAAAEPASPALSQAIGRAQQGIAQRLNDAGASSEHGTVSSVALLEEMHQRTHALKRAATTPVERATIEVVALLFQSLLTEERLPAAVRVWFARLQMPVLRVAVGEPEFFAAADHPARRLIDRMGACVMGFDTGRQTGGGQLEKEIKRIVQVVEAYPDTGRRVFQTVLGEFEKFLEHYFKNDNEASRKTVSLAQQVEQRETLAIQYTIELRKMLSEMPVQEGVREFLFQIWADVLAMTAARSGLQSDEIRAAKRTAADLIWSASAKVSREERAAVIQRLPPLLKTLRDGMAEAGLPKEKQDEQIQKLNTSLAAAFTARVAAISTERLDELMARLEGLEELLPDAEHLEIDESMVLDLSGHQSEELEVVSEGGSMPTKAMIAMARELQIGGWYRLSYRQRTDAVQLAWQGLRKQLALFVSPQGRGVLFHQNRLAAFLQAGLLLPAQEETLTVRATRSALAKIDADPDRLLN